MLVLTEAAADVITELTVQPNLPESVGLRISASAEEPGGQALTAALAAKPDPGDEVMDVRQSKLFLEHEAAGHLSDKVLDAERDGRGAVVFHVRQQDAE